MTSKTDGHSAYYPLTTFGSEAFHFNEDGFIVGKNGRPVDSRILFGAYIALENATKEELEITKISSDMISSLNILDEQKERLRSSEPLKKQMQGQLICFIWGRKRTP